MNENIKWFAAAAAVVGLSIGAVLYFAQGRRSTPAAEPTAASQTFVLTEPGTYVFELEVFDTEGSGSLPARDDHGAVDRE